MIMIRLTKIPKKTDNINFLQVGQNSVTEYKKSSSEFKQDLSSQLCIGSSLQLKIVAAFSFSTPVSQLV